MELPDKKSGPEKSGGVFSVLVTLLLIVAIISTAFLVYLKNQNVDLSSLNIGDVLKHGLPAANQVRTGSALADFKYDPDEKAAFGFNGSYIIKATENSIRWLDTSGEEQLSKPVSLGNPLVKTSGSYILVADIGGRDLFVIKGKEIKWNKKLDSSIINADINEKGYVSVVHEMKGYKGAASVYDGYGNWIFTTVRAEAYLLSAKVLPSGDRVLLNTVNVSGISPNSVLEYVDMSGKTITSVTGEDIIFPSAWHLNNRSIAAVSESLVTYYDEHLNKKWEHAFDRVYSSEVYSGKYIIAAVADKDQDSLLKGPGVSIKLIDTRGEARDIYALNKKVINIRASGSVIAVNTGKEVHFINIKGKLISKYTSKIGIDNVYLYARDEAAVVTKNSVVLVKFN